MTKKRPQKKLGRNPFDAGRPPGATRRRADVPAEQPSVESAAGSFPESRSDAGQGRSGAALFPSNPAWLLVDFWTGALTEPYFFWASSMNIMKKTLDLRSD